VRDSSAASDAVAALYAGSYRRLVGVVSLAAARSVGPKGLFD
jgi:hypothetical protein